MNAEETPLYFTSGGQTLFGWIHMPARERRIDVGLVVCKPFGYDAVCSHRSLRAFAAASAAIGLPVLRFDYAGTGDSSDPDADTDQIAAWSADILAAAQTLRRESGATRVCLLGLGLGALLAARAAAGGEAICGLIAIAPLINGRRYLRELRAFQAAAVKDSTAAQANGDLEVAGFRVAAASAQTLAQTDLMTSATAPARHVLVIDRSDLPTAKPWADAMRSQGAEVEYQSLPGFTDMMSTPHAAVVPRQMIAATTLWLERLKLALPAGPVAASAPGPRMPTARASVFADDGTAVEERALFIDEQRTLFAIVTRAAGVEAAETAPGVPGGGRRGVVLLNAGATSHIGPNRMYVSLARNWAARGHVVLRLDLAGLGDSATRPGDEENLAYPPAGVDDVDVAVDFLIRQYRVKDMTLAGLCAGAYHALRAAVAGLPVNRLLMVNPLTFFWKQGNTMNDLQMSEVVRNPGIYSERVMSGKYWLKLLRGRVNLWRVGMVYVRRGWLVIESSLRDLSHRLRIRLPYDLRWDLESIAGRGVRLVFLFARGDIGQDLLKIQGGAAVKAIGDRCRVYTIDGADHIFSQSEPRALLVKLLGSELTE